MLVLSLLPTVLAANPDQVPVGKVELSAPIEVPLYAGLDPADDFVYVELKAGEATLLLQVDTSSDHLRLTEAGAKKAGAKTKENNATGVSSGTAKSLELGGLKLSNAVFSVVPKASYGADGSIGLGAFGPDVSWSLSRSTGTLSIGPAASGAAWAAKLGNSLPYTRHDWKEKIKIGKQKSAYMDGFAVSLPWDGVNLPTQLDTGNASGLIYTEADTERWWRLEGVELPVYPLPAAPSVRDGESRWETRSLTLGGRSLKVSVERTGVGPLYAQRPPAYLGNDVLQHFDLALDAAARTVALAPAATSGLKSYAASWDAALRKKLEAAPGKDGAAPDAETVKKARAGGIPALAKWLRLSGDPAGSLGLARELTEIEADDCTAWQGYGDAAMAAGNPGEAVVAYRKAAELYEPWGSRSLEDRKKLQKDYDAAEKKKEPWSGVVPQSHACFTAWGQLARAQIASGQADKVAELYPSKLDLDDGLAVSAGVAFLVRGDAAAAEAAFRQAIHLDPSAAATARRGLFLALGNRELAEAQLERGAQVGEDLFTVATYADAIRKIDGGPKAVDAVKALLAADPQNGALALEYARQLAKDTSPDAAAAVAAARARLEAGGAATSREASERAAWALLLLAEGNTDAARSAADALVKASPHSGIAWWAAAQVAEAGGDGARASESFRKAGIVGAADPLYAMLVTR